jgi:hypothetical protein
VNLDSYTVQTTGWSAQLEATGLAAVSIDGTVVVDRLYFAVRDPDWATIALRIDDTNVAVGEDDVTVSMAGATDDATTRGSFSLRLTIAGKRLIVESTFAAEADLSVNRVGWCLLHPMSQVGSAVATDSPTGPSMSSLPIAIAPHSPFTDLSAMEITTPSHRLAFTFTGDLFETEDQRNWIDASFKTFSTSRPERSCISRSSWSSNPTSSHRIRRPPRPVQRPCIRLRRDCRIGHHLQNRHPGPGGSACKPAGTLAPSPLWRWPPSRSWPWTGLR